MFADLPEKIQELILYYLAANNFTAAKELYDQLARAPAIVFGENMDACEAE